jgi:sulfite reductase beta subunit-like hemoprotein
MHTCACLAESHLTSAATTAPSRLAGNLERGLVSCTGSQFCGFTLIETICLAHSYITG